MLGPGYWNDTLVSFSITCSTNIFEHLLCARLSASLKGTNLGKNNSDPRSVFAASWGDAPHMKWSPGREEAGGVLSEVSLRCGVMRHGQGFGSHCWPKKLDIPNSERKESHCDDVHVETMLLSFCTFS